MVNVDLQFSSDPSRETVTVELARVPAKGEILVLMDARGDEELLHVHEVYLVANPSPSEVPAMVRVKDHG